MERAEIIGIMLGDGSIYFNKQNNIHQTTVAGNLINDSDYLLNYVKPLFEKTFNVKMYVRKHSTHKELLIRNQTKFLVNQLDALGFPTGNKLLNNVGIPAWIFSKKKFTGACLRGIVDTDGSLAPKTKEHPAPSIWIKSAIPQLRKDISRCFRLLDYHPSRWTDQTVPQCCLGKSEEVLRYFKEVGFKNKYHLERFYKYCSPSLAAKTFNL